MSKKIKRAASILYNQVHVVGRLCNTPQKNFSATKKLYTRFLVKTKFQDDAFVPFIMYGRGVDIVCTKFQQGDVVAILAQICTRENRHEQIMIDFVVASIKLVTKSKIKQVTEDKFQKIVALYDKDLITDRLAKKKG